MTAATPSADGVRTTPIANLREVLRRDGWLFGLVGLVIVLLVFTKVIQPSYGAGGIQSLALNVLPLALAAVAQTVVVISGGIDLSIGSMMALTNVVAATQMLNRNDEADVVVAIGVLLLGVAIGAINGLVIVVTRVADIIVTLAMSFVWAGFALLLLGGPVRSSQPWLNNLVTGSLINEWIPRGLVVLAVVVAIVWIPLRRSRVGLSLYAIGSNRLAAFRSGVSIGRTKVIAYSVTGLFAAMGGLAITAVSGQGSPLPGGYTLASVAAVVLGGVSLAGGRGGVLGPVLGVIILSLIQTDMTFLRLNSNLATVLQGAILIGVVMLGSLAQLRRRRG
jgi:ribose transport system permease protein